MRWTVLHFLHPWYQYLLSQAASACSFIVSYSYSVLPLILRVSSLLSGHFPLDLALPIGLGGIYCIILLSMSIDYLHIMCCAHSIVLITLHSLSNLFLTVLHMKWLVLYSNILLFSSYTSLLFSSLFLCSIVSIFSFHLISLLFLLFLFLSDYFEL